MSIQQERKTLDGIKPVLTSAKRYQWTAPSTAAKAVARPKTHTPASIKPASRPHSSKNAAAVSAPKSRSHITHQPKPAGKPRNWMLVLHLCIAVVVFGGLIFFSEKSESTGQLLVLAYAVYALALRVPSRITFMLVLGAFASVILHLTVRPDTELVNTFSIYAFLLLIVSAISLGKEGRRQVRFN